MYIETHACLLLCGMLWHVNGPHALDFCFDRLWISCAFVNRDGGNGCPLAAHAGR